VYGDDEKEEVNARTLFETMLRKNWLFHIEVGGAPLRDHFNEAIANFPD
jgi:hypothetical protein